MTELTVVRAGLVVVLIAVGSFFLLVGTVGLLRLPRVYNRMHATSKATTLGAASLFLAGTVYFGPQGPGLTSLVGIAFLFATAPTGAHVISRAAQKMGVDFQPGVTWPLDEPVGTTDEATTDEETTDEAMNDKETTDDGTTDEAMIDEATTGESGESDESGTSSESGDHATDDGSA